MSYQDDFKALLDLNPEMSTVSMANEAWEHIGFAERNSIPISKIEELKERMIAEVAELKKARCSILKHVTFIESLQKLIDEAKQ